MTDIFILEFSEVINTPLNKHANNLPVLNNKNSIVVNLDKNDTLNIIQDRIAVRVTSEEGKTTIQASENFTVDYSNDNLPKDVPMVTFENVNE